MTRARQYPNESIRDFTTRIETLLTQLNRSTIGSSTSDSVITHVEATNSKLAKRTFEFGLANRELRTILLATQTTTLNEAFEHAIELHSYGAFDNAPPKTVQTNPRRADTCAFCKKRGHTEDICYSKRNQSERKNNEQSGGLTCNYCKEPGHLIADCVKRPKQRRNTRKIQAANTESDEEESHGDSFTLEEIAESQQMDQKNYNRKMSLAPHFASNNRTQKVPIF